MNTYSLSRFFIFLCAAFFVHYISFAAPPVNQSALRRNVEEWIEQLGNESYLVRRRAETHLVNSGLEAYPALQKAKSSEDIEIVRRAEKLLVQIEQMFMQQESPAVEYWVRQYTLESNIAAKARIIRLFADIFSDASNGEGLQTLCRIVRFDESETLRIEAAKCLMASPPAKPSLRKKWYRCIRENFAGETDNTMLSLLADYASLRCDMDEKTQDRTALQKQVRAITKRIAAFQAEPEYSVIQSGNQVDILMYYAAAIIEDAAGLNEESKKSTAVACAVVAQEVNSNEPVKPIELDDNWKMHEHYYAARWLRRNYRLHWALPHFDKMIADGYIVLRVRSAELAGETAVLLSDYSAAVRYYDKIMEMADSEEYTKKFNSGQSVKADAAVRRDACLAEQAAEAGEWKKVREYVDQSLAMKNTDIDLLILAHRYCKADSDADTAYRDKIKFWSYLALVNIQNGAMPPSNNPDDRRTAAVLACNQAAWLLANTDGDYSSAAALINAAVQSEPEDLSYQDTLSAVFFLGGEYGKAVETQERVVRSAPEVTAFQKALERFKTEQFKTEQFKKGQFEKAAK